MRQINQVPCMSVVYPTIEYSVVVYSINRTGPIAVATANTADQIADGNPHQNGYPCRGPISGRIGYSRPGSATPSSFSVTQGGLDSDCHVALTYRYHLSLMAYAFIISDALQVRQALCLTGPTPTLTPT